MYCAKSVPIRSYSGPHFPAFGLNTEKYEYLSVFSLNARKYRPGPGYAGIPTSYDRMKNVPASSKHNNKWLESSDLVYCPVSCNILSQLSCKQPLRAFKKPSPKKSFLFYLISCLKIDVISFIYDIKCFTLNVFILITTNELFKW